MKKKIVSFMLAGIMLVGFAMPVMADDGGSEDDSSPNVNSIASVEYHEELTDLTNPPEDYNKTEVEVTCASTFSVIIPKKIVLPGEATDEKHESNYNITVKGNIGNNEAITVTPASTVTLKQDGKTDVTANVTQTHTKYALTGGSVADADTTLKVAVADMEAGKTDTDTGKVSSLKLSAGTWTGTYTYTIGFEAE